MSGPKIWRRSSLDAILVGLSIGHFGATIALAATWADATALARVGSFILLTFMLVYNVIILSHLFTHHSWFRASALNSAMSMINSASIGQSVQSYELNHVRNHHRYNNDRPADDGTTKDTSSTFRGGRNGEHAGLLRYAFGGAVASLFTFVRLLLSVVRLFRVGANEAELRELASRAHGHRARELRQVQLDRLSSFLFLCLLVWLSWKWTVFCYLPALFIGLVLVNVQNYYRHYGACPESRYANSVSHYGRVYNFLTFNDGYHQEHHLRPSTHWSRLPEAGRCYRQELGAAGHVVSPVPAIVGFLDRGRVATGSFAVRTRSVGQAVPTEVDR